MLWVRSHITEIVILRISTNEGNTLERIDCVLKRFNALYEVMDTFMEPDFHSDVFINLIWIEREEEWIFVI